MQALANLEAEAGRRLEARSLYRLGIKVASNDPALYTGWASWEWRWGRQVYARKLFSRAKKTCKPHVPLLAAWADLEVRVHTYLALDTSLRRQA